jgi:hypothetical protein
MNKPFATIAVTLLAGLLFAASFQSCTSQENDVQAYVDFLYKYMPLPDSTDYPRDFYEQNVALALQARHELSWGRHVPEREFRHFVVPVRVNNENLDSSRAVFYRELKPRVEHLSMQEAILEVNHWCHEHVTYRPSDARTSSPLASLRTAYGRCGEESTFTVAALRAVGIPARQVYTPRWAHTDDNHAWVEAWADGRWYFLGACEPEPVLNLGWFNESASRGMLMHTKVFGDYDGPEEVMSRTSCYTEINVIDNYAPTSKVTVLVTDSVGQPVSDALVEFKLYNYAEFYTVAQKTTDQAGRASLTAGRGDLLLWVTKDGRVGYQQVSFDQDKEVAITLNSQFSTLNSPLSFDLVPPPVSASLPEVSAEQRAENNRRLAAEDSIRKAYEQTMPNEEWRGNHQVIQQFLDEAQDKDVAQRLLSVISKKDLRDITPDVLRDNIAGAANSQPTTLNPQLYEKYVLSPRVENEWLTPYKAFLREKLSHIGSIEELLTWVRDSITIVSDRNPQRLRMQPMSVYRYRHTDQLGRDIFFVSAARSLGFPARINEVNQKTQYWKDGQWIDLMEKGGMNSEKSAAATASTAGTAQPILNSQSSILKLVYQPVPHYDNPKYYIHFTLSKVGDDGRLQLMTFDEEATWQRDFAKGVELDDGDYILTTGTRLASGKVLACMQPFTLSGPTTVTFTMREDNEEAQVIGSLNAEDLYTPFSLEKGQGERLSLLSTTGRGYYILGLVAPNQEPTNHALRDIGAYREELEKWGRPMVLLFTSEGDAQRFNFAEFTALPATTAWGIDADGTIFREVREQMKLQSSSLPVFLVCDTFNRVVFVSQGYTIGLGEQLMKVVRQL